MGGLQDEKALDRFSALVGEIDLIQVSSTLDAANTATGRSVTITERTALRAEEIRLIPDGQALVIYRNAPAMLVDLIPWTDRPDGDDIAAGITRVRTARTTPPAMTNPPEHPARRPPATRSRPMPTADPDRLALLWNGFDELTARLDTTEDAVADTLDNLSTDIDDLKTQLTQLLKKEQEKDIEPRRWADRATAQDWVDSDRLGGPAQHRLLPPRAITSSRRAGPRTPASSKNSPASGGPGPAP